MHEAEVFEQTKGAYLCLIHPRREGGQYPQEMNALIALAPSVSDQLVDSLLDGSSWRERLLGLCLAMAKRPAAFIELILQSLREPLGIAIVPACAVLGILARHGAFTMQPTFANEFDRAVFDGEIGWAADKAMYYAGLRTTNVDGNGPNYGQDFEDHVELYGWIHGAFPRS
ncbi:MAG: hypothetical protein L0Y72_04270 [Gemmataceae bacterium]|nr:hypothetical protein [Gemmataceae bacterium]MCI0738235.1 hypothetical protein [Gemmataceae bacterium]